MVRRSLRGGDAGGGGGGDRVLDGGTGEIRWLGLGLDIPGRICGHRTDMHAYFHAWTRRRGCGGIGGGRGLANTDRAHIGSIGFNHIISVTSIPFGALSKLSGTSNSSVITISYFLFKLCAFAQPITISNL